MSTIPTPGPQPPGFSPAGLIHIDEFARRYRIHTSVIRDWVKRGYVDYEFVGGNHLRHKGTTPIVPVKAPKPPDKPLAPGWSLPELRVELVGYLLATDQSLTLEAATEMTETMDESTVTSLLKSLVEEVGSGQAE